MKEYFSIGELAELFGLNIQTLYYYDSVGIFSPRERNEKNGRRKYEFDQIKLQQGCGYHEAALPGASQAVAGAAQHR